MVATLGVKQSISVLENLATSNDSLPQLADAVNADAAKEQEIDSTPSDSQARARVDWPALVQRIQGGDDSAMGELYELFARGIRFYLCRQLGVQELDDKVHDTFLIVVQAIQRGDLREPEGLMGFVRTVVRRQVAAQSIKWCIAGGMSCIWTSAYGWWMGAATRTKHGVPAKVDFMVEILNQLSERDREILTRFYLHEETQEEICEEMNLTETQFRLLKSRAKARFGELGKRKLQQKMLVPFFSRISAG